VVTSVSVPGGNRNNNGGFNNVGNNGNWWSSSDTGSGNAWYRNLNYNNANVNRNNNDQRNGFSVRCAREWGNAATVCPKGADSGHCFECEE